MVAGLAALPDIDLDKLITFEASTEDMSAASLSRRPDLCFVDGEHSQVAALRDARFCAEAVGGRGVIAFHDQQIVEPAIRTFLKEAWPDVSHAVSFDGQVFAVELGGGGVLQSPQVDRAIASEWHSLVWRLASRAPLSALPLFAAWSAMPLIDSAVFEAKRHLRRG